MRSVYLTELVCIEESLSNSSVSRGGKWSRWSLPTHTPLTKPTILLQSPPTQSPTYLPPPINSSSSSPAYTSSCNLPHTSSPPTHKLMCLPLYPLPPSPNTHTHTHTHTHTYMIPFGHCYGRHSTTQWSRTEQRWPSTVPQQWPQSPSQQ